MPQAILCKRWQARKGSATAAIVSWTHRHTLAAQAEEPAPVLHNFRLARAGREITGASQRVEFHLTYTERDIQARACLD